MVAVPRVELGLQLVALGQQGVVARRIIGNEARETLVEGGFIDARSRKRLL